MGINGDTKCITQSRNNQASQISQSKYNKTYRFKQEWGQGVQEKRGEDWLGQNYVSPFGESI